MNPAPPFAGRSLAFAGGGTGGHIVPGLHLLEHLMARGDLPRALVWFHSGRPIEERVLAGASARFAPLAIEHVVLAVEPRGGGAPSLARTLLGLPRAGLVARGALARARCELLLGLGGFTTVPAALAARSLGIPVALLEINAEPGRATRALEPLARRVLHAWPASVPAQPRRAARHVLTGPPVAPRFRRAGAAERARAKAALAAELGLEPERPLLLVLGGSQGARALNDFVRQHAAALLARGAGILHQLGPGRTAEAAPAAAGYRALAYLDDVPAALAAADLALTRGGASTLAEIAAVGTPAWVVPYPHHADRHQEKNAAQLPGARIVPEGELGAALVDELAAELERLAAGGERAPACASGAAERLLDELAALLRPAPLG